MSIEENKALVRRWFEEMNKGKVAGMAVMDELHTADVIRHRGSGEEIRGIESYKQAISKFFDAYLDVHFTIDDMIAEGDKVVVRYTWTHTHKATNKKVTMWQIDISRIVNSKFVEKWARYDTLGVQQQLGVLPCAVPAKET